MYHLRIDLCRVNGWWKKNHDAIIFLYLQRKVGKDYYCCFIILHAVATIHIDKSDYDTIKLEEKKSTTKIKLQHSFNI